MWFNLPPHFYSPNLVQMRENTDQNDTEYGHFLRSEWLSLNVSSQLQLVSKCLLE